MLHICCVTNRLAFMGGGIMKNKKHVWILLDVLALFVIAISVLVAVFFCKLPEKSSTNIIVDVMSGWETADGETLSLNKLPRGDITLAHSLEGIDITNKCLCIKSLDTELEVFADGTSIYTYAPKQPSIIGASYGRHIHTVPLPAGTKEVTLSMHSVFLDAAPNIAEIKVAESTAYLREIFGKGLPPFCLCLLLVVFGTVMLFMGFASKDVGENQPLNFYSIGMLAILVGLWSVNDTYIMQVLTQCPAIIKLVTYLCLIFVSYPPVSFVAGITNQRETILLPILMALTMVNFVLTITLSALKISDLRYMLNMSHAVIIIAIIMAIVLAFRAIRQKTVKKKTIHTLLIGMVIVVVGVAVDLARYRGSEDSSASSSTFTMIGVLFFMSTVGLYLIREHNRLVIEHSRAELMEKIAYTDGLTELNNRAAFHKKEKELIDNGGSCVIVQFDVNNLKKVNDEYGHAEGDKHIISAANIIHDSFSDIGECYRTGGDEFIAVVERGDIKETEMALAAMQQKADTYNSAEHPPVNLQIAFGYAKCSPPEDTLDVAERLADERMYSRKRDMKQAVCSKS